MHHNFELNKHNTTEQSPCIVIRYLLH